jgi:hypothetical protein
MLKILVNQMGASVDDLSQSPPGRTALVSALAPLSVVIPQGG